MDTIANLHSTLKRTDDELQSAMTKLDQQYQEISELKQNLIRSKEKMIDNMAELEKIKSMNEQKIVEYWELRERYEHAVILRDSSKARLYMVPQLLKSSCDNLILKSDIFQDRCEKHFERATLHGLWSVQTQEGEWFIQ